MLVLYQLPSTCPHLPYAPQGKALRPSLAALEIPVCVLLVWTRKAQALLPAEEPMVADRRMHNPESVPMAAALTPMMPPHGPHARSVSLGRALCVRALLQDLFRQEQV